MPEANQSCLVEPFAQTNVSQVLTETVSAIADENSKRTIVKGQESVDVIALSEALDELVTFLILANCIIAEKAIVAFCERSDLVIWVITEKV